MGHPNGKSKRSELRLGSALELGPMVDTIHYEMGFDELIIDRYMSNMQEAFEADMSVRACFRQQCLCNLASSWEKCAIVKKLDFWWTLRLQQSLIFCPIVEGG
jgi:ABC-type microcin C transport system permease subunit YejB